MMRSILRHYRYAPILPQALVIEAIDLRHASEQWLYILTPYLRYLGDLSSFVVSSDQLYPVRVANLYEVFCQIKTTLEE